MANATFMKSPGNGPQLEKMFGRCIISFNWELQKEEDAKIPELYMQSRTQKQNAYREVGNWAIEFQGQRPSGTTQTTDVSMLVHKIQGGEIQ